jgi:hypothetical protein
VSSVRITPEKIRQKEIDVREHRYSFEMPHSAARIWALFQDYDRWTDYAPMVIRVDVIYPGDDDHNGRLRRVIFKMPFGRQGSALELVTDVEAGLHADDRGRRATTRSAVRASSHSGRTARGSASTSDHLTKRPGSGSRARSAASSTEQRRLHASGLGLARPPVPPGSRRPVVLGGLPGRSPE